MKKKTNKFLDIVIRYVLLVLIILPGFDIFYYLFLPLTKYTTFYFLKLFYSPYILGNSIFVGRKIIEIAGACIGGSAYYFLLTLNLATFGIQLNKRLKMVIISFFTFFILNLIRILILSLMYLNDSPIFDVAHKILWYFGSTILVITIWFFQVNKFAIEKTPFYSDLHEIYKHSHFNRNRHNRRIPKGKMHKAKSK